MTKNIYLIKKDLRNLTNQLESDVIYDYETGGYRIMRQKERIFIVRLIILYQGALIKEKYCT